MKGWSKTTRISVMMALDTVFLVIELGVGYYVSSLALIADAFHMLNDIISLAVGLWAVNLARKESNDRYSYGWLRAEILGAFFNATFLIGLCVTIVLEAIQRFFDPPNISNPEAVLIVGCFGLASNVVGFWVLGGHGHSHGPGDEEAGNNIADGDADEHNDSHVHDHGPGRGAHVHADGAVHDGGDADSCPDEGAEADEEARAPSPEATRFPTLTSFNAKGHARSESRSSARSRGTTATRGRANSNRRGPTTINDISIHPALFRNDIREIIAASQSRTAEDDDEESDDATVGENAPTFGGDSQASGATETTPLIGSSASAKYTPDNASNSNSNSNSNNHSHNESHSHVHHHGGQSRRRDSHGGHHHSVPRDEASGGDGHSHADMGMKAMVLHVFGDMLGNIGVIVTALIIWKTSWTYRMYADPVVSLLITLIILKTALPLTKATSKILLQATPDHININDIREDIGDLDGVLSCHHVHVWQLSDTQIVASLHIEVEFPISDHGGEKYMALARRVRKCLHGFGIHSATIQPEFRIGDAFGSGHSHDHGSDQGHLPGPAAVAATTSASAATATSSTSHPGGVDANAGGPSCLLDCVDNCVAKGCCSANPPSASQTGSPLGSSRNSEHGGHSH